ncbi:MAG TPA: substrate-binding domain-containing protein [Stellaceae bacterium]|nr:substrate-binding domain-containing protein [Stellaceae bacterium]
MSGTHRSGIALVLAAALPMLAGSSTPAGAEITHTQAIDELAKAADTEGQLNIVWGSDSLGGGKGAAALQEAINREFHTHVKILYTPGPSMPQMSTRIIQEVKAGQPASSDAYLGVSVNLPAMIVAHVLDEVPWSSYVPSITQEMQTKNHEAVLAFTLFEGFSRNTQLISDDEAPHDVAGLFRPEWKGKLASTPYAAGFDELALEYGDAKIRPIVEKIAQWAGGLIRCGDYGRIASGEFLGLVLDCGQISSNYMVENGGPVKLGLLDDALGTELTYLAVPKTSAHPNLAKLFAAYVATPDGQAIIAKYGATSHMVPGTPGYQRAQSIAARGLKLVVYTPDTITPRLEEAEKMKVEYERILVGK